MVCSELAFKIMITFKTAWQHIHIVNECLLRRFSGTLLDIHNVTDDALVYLNNLDLKL